MSPCFTISEGIPVVTEMQKRDASTCPLKGVKLRTAQQQLYQKLERGYAYPPAICRSLVNDFWEFLQESFGDALDEGQITINAVAADEPPGKKVQDLHTIPTQVTVHEEGDIEALTQYGIAELRRRKIVRMTNEAKDQGCYLTQEDLAALLCSSIRTIKRDIKSLRNAGITVPTRGTMKDIGPGVSHKARIVELWLQGYEYTDLERKTGHSGASIQRYLSGFSKVVKFLERGYSEAEIRELTELSERVLREYRDLYLTYKDRPETQTRFHQVLAPENGGGKTSVQQDSGEQRARRAEV